MSGERQQRLRVAITGGTSGLGLALVREVAQHLESLGHEVVVADPNYTPM